MTRLPLGPGSPSDIEARPYPKGGGAEARALGIPPGRLQGPQLVGVEVSMPPPELVQYPSARDLYLQGQAAIATGADSILATFQLQEGFVGVVRSILLYGISFTVGANATWAVLVNGSPVEGWVRVIPPQNATTALVSYGPDETLIRLPTGAQLQLRGAVSAGGPLTIGMQCAGWFYPATLADRFAAAWGG